MTKIAAENNRRLWSWSAFLWRLPTFSQTRWRCRSTSFDVIKLLRLLSTPVLLSCSTRPLGQVALPIWLGDLQSGRALRGLCYHDILSKSPYICLRRGLTKKRIIIRTDSQSVITALAANRAGMLLVVNLWKTETPYQKWWLKYLRYIL